MSAGRIVDVVEVAFSRAPCELRMPFRFGGVTLERADALTCRLLLRDARGRRASGWSSDLLAPRWFRKDTDASPVQDAAELHSSAVAAAVAVVNQPATTAFGLWRGVMEERVEPFPFDAPDQLVRGFGVALVERALLDASCRLLATPFADALRQDAFGFRPADVHGALSGWDWQHDLPAPRERIAVRHTVGMLDPLRRSDLEPEQRIQDGLPQTLEEDLDVYGGRWLKVKIGAGIERDCARLLDLARFCDERGATMGFSLDGNEQYADLGEVAELLEAVAADPAGARMLAQLAWIEQPLPRSVTYEPARHRALDRVERFAPLLIDEADATPRSFERARAVGYRGVSVKNCKGVFRALANFGVCRRDQSWFQSGEDLTNVGVLALQQDLVTHAVLGLPHVERNGHRYLRGLDHLPEDVARRALQQHSDLYRVLDEGVALRIVAGEVAVGSALQSVGYGTEIDDFGIVFDVAASS